MPQAKINQSINEILFYISKSYRSEERQKKVLKSYFNMKLSTKIKTIISCLDYLSMYVREAVCASVCLLTLIIRKRDRAKKKRRKIHSSLSYIRLDCALYIKVSK